MYEDKNIPAFFSETWRRREQAAKRYPTKYDYDPIKDYNYEENLFIGATTNGMLIMALIVFFICGVLGSLSLAEPDYSFSNLYCKIAIGCSIICLAIICLLIWLFTLPSCEDGNGNQYYKAVDVLFSLFDISPSEEIGAMSSEEFRANIEDALKKKAATVDDAIGFEKTKLRNEFNAMHAAALEWELCHKDHARYYPNKK
jgi:hypothetical protein